MENATKALIIAGAILLTIAVIAIGMMIYTQSQAIVTDVPLDSITVASHNNRFLTYTGKPQKGSSIAGLPAETLAYNKILSDPLQLVEIVLKDKENTEYTLVNVKNEAGNLDKSSIEMAETEILDKILATAMYKVLASYNDSGYITKIIIREQ